MYVGTTLEQFAANTDYRYFYGIRRTEQGELFLGKLDYFSKNDSISINKPGVVADNLPSFAEGEDFFEGRNVKHEIVYENLNYEQFVWGNNDIYYFVNDEGELILKIYESHTYESGVSSDGKN